MNENQKKLTEIWESGARNYHSPMLDAVRAHLYDVLSTDNFESRPENWVSFRALCDRISWSEGFERPDFDGKLPRKLMVLKVKGDWHITNADMETWQNIASFDRRDFFPDWWRSCGSRISNALTEKRRWQAFCRYEDSGVRQEHQILLSRIYLWEVDYFRGDWVSLYTQGKRPFGDSGVASSMHEILGWEANWGDDEGMPLETQEKLWDLFDELPYAMHEIFATWKVNTPDLLAACEAAMSWLEAQPIRTGVAAQIRLAIDKAKGEDDAQSQKDAE